MQSLVQIKQELATSYTKVIENYMWDKDMALKFMSSVSYAIEKTPKLLEVDKSSLFSTIISCAELKMFPWISGEVYILPYKNKAQFILWYQWLVTLLYRAGITSISAQIVKENDEFEQILWLDPTIKHIPPKSWPRWDAIGCYVVAKFNGQTEFKYMSKDEILKYKEFSQSANAKEQWQRDSSPWNEKNDPELNMWKKTVLKQLAKILPKNEDIFKAIDQDNQESDIKEYIDEKIKEQNQETAISKAKELNNKYLIDNSKEIEDQATVQEYIDKKIKEPEIIEEEKSDFRKEQEEEIRSKKEQEETKKQNDILDKQEIAHKAIKESSEYKEAFESDWLENNSIIQHAKKQKEESEDEENMLREELKLAKIAFSNASIAYKEDPTPENYAIKSECTDECARINKEIIAKWYKPY